MNPANQFCLVAAISTALLAHLPIAAAEGLPLNLVCLGDIEFSTDSKVQSKPLTINLSIDLEGKTAELSGDWGCLADMGSGQGSTLCGPRVPVSVSDSEVAFSRKGPSELYATQSSFVLDRNSGQLAKLDLLVIDDFAISPMGASERNDLLEVLDDRVGTRSTLITSQLPVKAWHTYLDDPTLADAILDRIVHSSHKIDLKGTSLRDKREDQ